MKSLVGFQKKANLEVYVLNHRKTWEYYFVAPF